MSTQTKLERITLFPGERIRENKMIIRLLKKLRRKNIVFEIVNDSLILKDTVSLPFIKTNTGEVYYGKSIKKFLEKQ